MSSLFQQPAGIVLEAKSEREQQKKAQIKINKNLKIKDIGIQCKKFKAVCLKMLILWNFEMHLTKTGGNIS